MGRLGVGLTRQNRFNEAKRETRDPRMLLCHHSPNRVLQPLPESDEHVDGRSLFGSHPAVLTRETVLCGCCS